MPRHPAILATALVAASACGSAAPAPTVTPTRTASAPPPTPSPTPPDTGAVQVVAGGLGAYLLTAVPVAVVHNTSTFRTASVHVDFAVVSAAGRQVATASTDVAAVPPGASTVAAARIDVAAVGDHSTATVTVTAWTEHAAPPPVATATGGCGDCPSGPGYGTVPGAVTGPGGTPPPPAVDVAAACYDGAGAIVGGGTLTATPGAGGAVSVPVITVRRPARCDLSAQSAF